MADINSRYQRFYSITSDNLGIDPLKDRLIKQLMRIANYDIHEILQDERAAPDLISLRRYGTDEFWWHILAYNGICSYRDIVEGKSLRIPAMTEIIGIVTENTLRPNLQSRVVTI